MADRFSTNWMWSDAFALLVKAERMHQQFFEPRYPAVAPAWEPPVDVIETDSEVLVFAALPGVPSDQVEAGIEDGHLVLCGERILPRQLTTATIHRMELPQGRFRRRIPLPPGRYASVTRTSSDGCLIVTLKKAEAMA